MRRAALLSFVVVSAPALSGCFTTSADFRSDAEEYIETTVAEKLEVEFVSVECETPESRDVGTRFRCTATDSDDGNWVFDNEITEENQFTVNVDRRP
jgi:hypothetical protein